MTDRLVLPEGFIGGCLPRTDRLGDTFAVADIYGTYPRSQWPELEANQVSTAFLIRSVLNQGNEGSCNCQAGAQGLRIALEYMNRDWVPPDGFSAMPAYKALARGPNQGTVISDVLKYMRDVGTLPLDTPANKAWMAKNGLNPDHVMPMTGYYTPMPRGCEGTQKLFRIKDARDCPTAETVLAGAADNKPGVIGYDMHAMCSYGFRSSGRDWLIDCVNSWGRQGDPLGPQPAIQYGRRSVSIEYLNRQIGRYGAYVIEAAEVPGLFR